MHGETGDIARSAALYLAAVYPGTKLYTERWCCVQEAERGLDGAARSRKREQVTVARVLHHAATKALRVDSHELVEIRENFVPLSVADPGCKRGRAHDVRKDDAREL